MSYDEHDAAWDDFYERISDEIYPEHYERAIEQFTSQRLKSYYVKNSFVMRPAIDSLQLGKKLVSIEEPSPALVFCVSAIELLLKASLLKPVVYGLVHYEPLAEIVMSNTLGQAGFDRYEDLLSRLFLDLAKIELKQVKRDGIDESLLVECKALQKLRNGIIHRGEKCTKEDAIRSLAVSGAVFDLIVLPMLHAIGLTVIEKGEIVPTFS